MEVDRNGFEVLRREECLRLLATASFGRVALHSKALPIVLPVNYVLGEQGIVFRTARGTKLAAATRNTVVAFEVDEIDEIHHTGWSVLVTGVARDITDSAELDEMSLLPLDHWAPFADRYVCISMELVSGRRTVSDRGISRLDVHGAMAWSASDLRHQGHK